MRKLFTTTLLSVVLLGSLTACNPEQFKLFMRQNGIDYSHMTDQQIKDGANAATLWWQETLRRAAEEAAKPKPPPPPPPFVDKFAHVLSPDQLYRLRWCESGDNYRAVSSSGTYRGAYQFSRSAWDSTAKLHYPEFVGWDPIAAPPVVQDAMTRALWSMRGRYPWPHCGLRV